MSPNSGREGSVLASVNSATAGHLLTLLEVLTKLLKRPTMDAEARYGTSLDS